MTEFHIQGDGGVELAVEVFDKINQQTPIKGKRFGMVHGLMRPPDLLARLADYDVQLLMNAKYLFRGADTITQLETMYGPDKVAGMSPVRSVIDAGLKPTLELTNMLSTGGGMDLSEYYENNFYLQAMEHFITRKNNDTGRVWGPHERITREEALKMATAWAARFYGDEDIMGTIEPGKLADLVVLGGDFMTVPAEQISDLPILKVIVGGKITYEKK